MSVYEDYIKVLLIMLFKYQIKERLTDSMRISLIPKEMKQIIGDLVGFSNICKMQRFSSVICK